VVEEADVKEKGTERRANLSVAIRKGFFQINQNAKSELKE
jgi:hypothetical protein